jgi:hypothetical protein
MSAQLKPAERARIRKMSYALRDANRVEVAAKQWRGRVLVALADGPATRYELAVELCGRGTSPSTPTKLAIDSALRKLIAEGLVRERPELEPGGRRVRVEPVVVLELVEQGSAAA